MTKRNVNWHKNLVKKALSDPGTRAAYETFKLQLEIADKLKSLRDKAHLTQTEIAEKMETTKSVVARLEAGGGKAMHSPSISTLAKYACALGYKVNVKFVPK